MTTETNQSAPSRYAGHTPGPWSLAMHSRNPLSFYKVENDKRVICDAFSHSAEDKANARLIADAPKLLAQRDEVLKALKLAEYELTKLWRALYASLPGNDSTLGVLLKTARAAIAKAEDV